jgi:hypothetical protein
MEEIEKIINQIDKEIKKGLNLLCVQQYLTKE